MLLRKRYNWHRQKKQAEQIQVAQNAFLNIYSLESEFLKKPVKIAFISDLHCYKNHISNGQNWLNVLNGQKPDWLVMGGDLIQRLNQLDYCREYLQQFTANTGRIAINGNRESRHLKPAEFWNEYYRECGFTYLHNRQLNTNNGYSFYGLDDIKHGAPSWDNYSPSNDLPIILSHSPDNFIKEKKLPESALCLCGHTHAGQFRLPYIGPLFTSSKYGYYFDKGWFSKKHDNNEIVMYINSGIGSTGYGPLKRRLFCPTEAVIINIYPKL